MIADVPMLELPVWLQMIEGSGAMQDSIPRRDLLDQSLFYPSCGIDGDPVRFLSGAVWSFVYVDYGRSRESIIAEIDSPSAFRGYELIGRRELNESELTPHSWTPNPPKRGDGNPNRYQKHIVHPFATWAIFSREQGFPSEHGPEKFSLLYIGGDGVATFQALYHGNGVRPRVVAIIQPGTGFGFNWTDFREEDRIFGRSVLRNPAGPPEYLLYGGWGIGYSPACWPSYCKLICFLRPKQQLGLWGRDRPAAGAD